jgi:iron complex transport system permease protein
LVRRFPVIFACLVAALAVAVLFRLLVGDRAGGLHFPESGEILSLRLGRLFPGLLVGASLSISGVLLQSLLRNPLASPDLIGPAAGAGLAVTARAWLFYLGSASGGAAAKLDSVDSGAAANAPAAMVGAVGALAVVYSLSQRRGFLEPISLILTGVIISILCGAATMFLGHLLPDGGFRVSRWAIGNLSEETSNLTLALVAAAALAGLLLGVSLGPSMDVAALSDDEARSTGLNLARLRVTLFILAGTLTAGAVVLAGPVGFVGLVCPHIVRRLCGPAHRPLILGSAIAGAALIVGADALSKVLAHAFIPGGGIMPIGILTALIGGPVFIVLLRTDAPRLQ